MKKNNFFMMTVFGVMALLGTSFELHSSEKSSLAPYIVGGSVVIGASIFAVTQTATYQTYSADQVRRVEEKEKSDNPLLYAEPLSKKRSSSDTSIMSDKVQAYLDDYEKQRRAEAQKYATKKNTTNIAITYNR
jgi:hypothetical protein